MGRAPIGMMTPFEAETAGGDYRACCNDEGQHPYQGEIELAADDVLKESEIESGVTLTCQSFSRMNCKIAAL